MYCLIMDYIRSAFWIITLGLLMHYSYHMHITTEIVHHHSYLLHIIKCCQTDEPVYLFKNSIFLCLALWTMGF